MHPSGHALFPDYPTTMHPSWLGHGPDTATVTWFKNFGLHGNMNNYAPSVCVCIGFLLDTQNLGGIVTTM